MLVYRSVSWGYRLRSCCKKGWSDMSNVQNPYAIPYFYWLFPKGSMYGIFTYIYHRNQPNVGKYTIHGLYVFVWNPSAGRLKSLSTWVASSPAYNKSLLGCWSRLKDWNEWNNLYFLMLISCHSKLFGTNFCSIWDLWRVGWGDSTTWFEKCIIGSFPQCSG